MPKRTRSKDVAEVKLTGTTVTLKSTKRAPSQVKRTIHDRRAAPPVPKGKAVADAFPTDPVTVARTPAKPPATGRKRRG